MGGRRPLESGVAERAGQYTHTSDISTESCVTFGPAGRRFSKQKCEKGETKNGRKKIEMKQVVIINEQTTYRD